MTDQLLETGSKLFGSRRRTDTLVMIALLDQTYARELTRLLDAPLRSIQTILADLEKEGIVAARPVGRTRQVEINPRYFAAAELRATLLRLGEADPRLQEAAARRRARPRRSGRPL